MGDCDNISSDSIIDDSMYIPTKPFAAMTEKESTSDEESDSDDSMVYKTLPNEAFASMPAKESSDKVSVSDDSRVCVDNNQDDTEIDDNLNTKPRAIEVEKSDKNREKETSKRKSQVSICVFMNPKKKSVSKEVNINIETTECNSNATGSLDNSNKVTPVKMNDLVLIKQKQFKISEDP